MPLCAIPWILQPRTRIHPSKLSTRSLRTSGLMTLLQGGGNSDIIKLLGRWKSDAMMDYLHQTSLPDFQKLAIYMFNNGQHTFLSGESVPHINSHQPSFSFPPFFLGLWSSCWCRAENVYKDERLSTFGKLKILAGQLCLSFTHQYFLSPILIFIA